MIKKFIMTLSIIGSMLSFFSCKKALESIIYDSPYTPTLSSSEIEAQQFTPEIMLKMARIGEGTLSPNGKYILYTMGFVDVADNKNYSNIYFQRADGSDNPKPLTSGKFKDYNGAWSSDSKHIYFLSDRDGKNSMWRGNIETGRISSIKGFDKEINNFGLAAKGSNFWFTSQVKCGKGFDDHYPQFKSSKYRIYDDLMVRHWDHWNSGEYSHVHVASFEGDTIVDVKDIMEYEEWDSPLSPYYNPSEITINNEGTQIAYTAKKLKGKEYALSTNSNIYLYDIESETTRNLTEGMPGYDKSPLFSPDDLKLAWLSQERSANESDKQRLFVLDLATDQKRYLTADFDYNAQNLAWIDNTNIAFIAPYHATHQICRVSSDGGGKVNILTNGDYDYTSLSIVDGIALSAKNNFTHAPELFTIELATGKEKQLTFANNTIYDNLKLATVEKRMVETTDKKEMLTWVIYPPEFNSAKKYPVILYCQGGPQSVVSQFWSYRWNLSLLASQGYIVVAPNRRGVPSFGQEWLDQISGDYSGQNIDDYLSAIDNVSSEMWADTTRMACVGASYGGYSAYYLASHHNNRFKTFVSHCGVFNFESFYLSTEELWFPNTDLGGGYWQEGDTIKRSYDNSPHKFVDKWNSSMLIITGEKDFRIPYTQSLQAYTAARLQGLEARLLVFEDEGHQVFKPQNSLVWHHEVYDWLDKEFE